MHACSMNNLNIKSLHRHLNLYSEPKRNLINCLLVDVVPNEDTLSPVLVGLIIGKLINYNPN